MAKYKCSVCGYVFEETENKKFEDLAECPVCGQPLSKFQKLETTEEPKADKGKADENPLAYPAEYVRYDENCRYMAEIH